MKTAYGRRGLANIWFAIIGVVLVGFLGLSVDVGYVYVVGIQLKNAADAAALAACLQVRSDQTAARLAAVSIASANQAAGEPVELDLNPGNNPDGDIVIGVYDRSTRVFTPTVETPRAVKVVARRTADSPGGKVPLFFGSLFGISGVDLWRYAIAVTEGGVEAGMLVLDNNDGCALSVTGNAVLMVDGGDIQVNSDHAQAICLTGSAQMHAENIHVGGNIKITGSASYTGQLHTGAPPQDDPLADLAEPTYDPENDLGRVEATSSDVVDMVPGYYSGGVVATGSSTVNMAPGIYSLGGDGLDISGGASLFAEGAVIHIVGSGAVDLSGTGTIQLSPPNPEIHSFPGADTYEGISIFQARDNSSVADITGTSLFNLQGLLYFPANHLELSGTGESFGNQVIANTVELDGTSEITIYYLGGGAVGRWTVFLVE